MLRSLIGSYVLFDLGIRADQHFGGLLYRVGPDPKRDVLRFCAPNNVGIYTTGGACAFHSWLDADGYVIDFSVGDWPAMTPRSKDRPCADGLQWTIEQPPSYWVKSADKVRRGLVPPPGFPQAHCGVGAGGPAFSVLRFPLQVGKDESYYFQCRHAVEFPGIPILFRPRAAPPVPPGS